MLFRSDDSSLGKRRKELENQIATAEALRQQQEELVKAIDETSPDALNKSGEQIQQLKELYEETAETLHRAELQTTTWMIRAISSARRMAEAKQAVRANESARASLQVDRTVPARRHAKYAKVQIDKLVSQIKAKLAPITEKYLAGLEAKGLPARKVHAAIKKAVKYLKSQWEPAQPGIHQ